MHLVARASARHNDHAPKTSQGASMGNNSNLLFHCYKCAAIICRLSVLDNLCQHLLASCEAFLLLQDVSMQDVPDTTSLSLASMASGSGLSKLFTRLRRSCSGRPACMNRVLHWPCPSITAAGRCLKVMPMMLPCTA